MTPDEEFDLDISREELLRELSEDEIDESESLSLETILDDPEVLKKPTKIVIDTGTKIKYEEFKKLIMRPLFMKLKRKPTDSDMIIYMVEELTQIIKRRIEIRRKHNNKSVD